MPLTSRLMIEPLGHEHAEGLVAALSHPSVGDYVGGPDVTTVAAQHERIDRLANGPGPERPDERWWNWAVCRRTDGLVLGYVQATSYGEWAEVAYVFGPATSGHGFATEAVRWLIEHLHAVGAHELWATVHPDNDASVRLLERVGFVPAPRPGRPVASFDDGDLVFRWPSATGSAAGTAAPAPTDAAQG